MKSEQVRKDAAITFHQEQAAWQWMKKIIIRESYVHNIKYLKEEHSII